MPGAPGQIRANDVYKDACVIHWSAPMSDGGSHVTGYHLERRPANTTRWLKINAEPIRDTTYHCVDLVEGTAYEFRVTAENRIGLGK